MTKWDKKTLGPDQIEKIKRDKAAGLTVDALVEKYRSSKGAIYRALKKD